MKNLLSFALPVVALWVSLHLPLRQPLMASYANGDLCNQAGQYCINRQTSSYVCKVQEATEAQAFGPNLAGPFGSRAAATAAMCKTYYDPGSPDEDKCGGVLPNGVCDGAK